MMLDYYRDSDEHVVHEIENDMSSVNVIIIEYTEDECLDIGMVGSDGYEKRLSIYDEEVGEFADIIHEVTE